MKVIESYILPFTCSKVQYVCSSDICSVQVLRGVQSCIKFIFGGVIRDISILAERLEFLCHFSVVISDMSRGFYC